MIGILLSNFCVSAYFSGAFAVSFREEGLFCLHPDLVGFHHEIEL